MVIREIGGYTSAIASPSGEVVIDMHSYGTAFGIEIVRIMIDQTAGSGTTFIFSIGDVSGFVTGSIHEKYLSGVTAAATTLDVTVSKFMRANSSGKLYFRFTPDAGADNVYSYSVMYKR